MLLRQIKLTNVRAFPSLTWDLPEEKGVGWHVVIGDNGAGKSSFLRAAALALVGPTEALALRQSWNDWLRAGQQLGNVSLAIDWNNDEDLFSGKGRVPKNDYLRFMIAFERAADSSVSIKLNGNNVEPTRHIWGGNGGWFSASYGPFRRFTGGDKDQEKLFYSNPKLARHLSVFGESVALTESLGWMQQLKFKKLEGLAEGRLVDPLVSFINQEGFLPNNVRLRDISSDGVQFVDAGGSPVRVENLSDGYRSILSMTFELIRQLAMTFGPDAVFATDGHTVRPSGVVLIDEIDTHLHPTWQRVVGLWFRRHFPNLQFIVTTHSPLVCQAADIGTVFLLPPPGSEEEGQMVTGTALDRLLYGNVLDAYGTGVFGYGVTESDASQHMLEELAMLNQKELAAHLSPQERERREYLRRTLPTAASVLPTTIPTNQ